MSRPAVVFPLADADKCVKCALCLPHCPTYRESLDEGESPRGRIALMQGFASGALHITPKLTRHLDRCLDCRACEAVCPADVPYGKLMDAARAELLRHGYRETALARSFALCMRHPRLLRGLQLCLWLIQRLRLDQLAIGAPRLQRLVTRLPPITRAQPWPRIHTPAQDSRREVQLFLGCIARITEPQVTQASIRLLNALGYWVRIPAGQGCCGALDQHAGRINQAAALIAKNLAAFTTDSLTPVLNTASGCAATLREYPLLISDARAPAFSARSQEISDFLCRQPQLRQIKFKPLPARVLIHSPCTLKNVLKTHRSVAKLLHHIPELRVDMLPDSSGCCGAAGSYMLSEPQLADRLADQLVALIPETRPGFLVTSNVGCRLHLRAALRRHAVNITVLHPLELLVQQLPDSLPAL